MKFIETYSGKKLLEKHSLSQEGTWAVYGEDPNYELGGHHHEPLLGYYTGKLVDVIDLAKNFWSCGRIKLITALEVKDSETTRIAQAREALKKAKAEIIKLELELCPNCPPGSVCRTPKCKRLV